ncbi:hypothetical protein C1646_764737 [Rhizophagus diaphanus]|nr:hypothetical protein C1646_764737 [Rhizophagus diaphanus] [Rhizophagus sp. MUCL 43196]
MPKHKEYTVTLISLGLIVDALHYGPFYHNWWISRPSEKRENPIFLHPIGLRIKTLVNLKDRDFIIKVVETFSNYGQIPGYICKCDGIQSELCESLTAAVNSVYKEIFQTNAKYLGPAVMGFDIPIISEALLKDLPFRAFLFPLGKLNIWVFGIGKSNNNEWNFAGTGYKTSFIYTYRKKRCVFVQELEDNHYQVTIYSENEICNIYVDNNPELVWKEVAILQQYEGKELFGLENNKIQQLVLSTPSCTLKEWNDDDCEFWLRSSAPTVDQKNLMMLYKQGFINPIPVHFQNKTEIFWNSFREAVNINKNGYDGKTCILSIIAKKFSYEKIKSNLNVSNDAIRYARNHTLIHGAGNQVWNKPVITCEKLSTEMQEQLQVFLIDKVHVVMSSYKTDAATNEPVHYLKQTKTALWKKYHEQYLDRIQRTTFFTKLEGNKYIYRENLGGLCLTCQKYGYEIFSDLIEYINKYITQSYIQEHLLYYLAHQTRKVYLNAKFNANLLALDEKTAPFLVDYKMKILPKTAQETKSDWFGKKGWSLHSILVYTTIPTSTKLQVQAFDHWFPDTQQDSWFTATLLHAVLETLDSRPESPKWYNVKVKKWVFLEAGEAKTAIDSHHAQISYTINRYVWLGFDIQTGKDIENAIQDIQRTSVTQLVPNRDRRSGSNTLTGNSNWFEWQWPTSGDFERCILARSIPNLGPWTTFTSTQLEKLQKREIEKPNPNISTPTISNSNWKIPPPNSELLVKKLQSRGIELNGKENKEELVINLEKELNKEVEHKKLEPKRIVGVDVKKVYPLQIGWALKENQNFGKKRAGKRMTNQVRALLEGYFMAGNADKSNCYTT